MIKIISNDFNKKRGRPIFVRPFHLFLLNFFCKIVNLTNHRYNTIHDQFSRKLLTRRLKIY